MPNNPFAYPEPEFGLYPGCPEELLQEYSQVEVVTFDVFDTVLARNCLEPGEVFLEATRRMKLEGIRCGLLFKRARMLAERNVAEALGKSPALVEIYQFLRRQFRWNSEMMQRAMELELSIEREWSIPLPGGVVCLAAARELGEFRGFVSDMYLSSEFIRDLLRRANLWRGGDKIWVSCEQGCSKKQGKLFRKIQEEIGWEPSKWLHVGDDPKRDYKGAIEAGLRSYAMPARTIPPRLQKNFPGKFLKRRSSTESALCGAIERAIRQGKFHNLNERESAIWEATCTGVAPIICNFTLWALHNASALGLKDLWCFARDGQIVHRIAQILLPKLDLELTTRYMPASRQAFRLAGLREVGDFELSWILGTYGKLQPDVVIERLGGGEKIKNAVAAKLASAGLAVDAGLDADGLQILREWVLSPEGTRLIEQSAAQQRALVLEYLDQEGVTKPFGVLDIGWAGSLQDGLRKMLSGSPYQQDVLHGFYFGLLRGTNRRPDSAFHSFLFEPEAVTKLHRKAIQVFEMFFAADHPQVQGFYKGKNSLVEVECLSSKSWQIQLDWGVKIQQEAIFTFARELQRAGMVQSQQTWLDPAQQLFDDFLLKPSISEAKIYATWVVGSFVGIDTKECLGPVLDTKRVTYYMENLSLTSHHWQPIMKKVNDPMNYFRYRVERLIRATIGKLIK